MEKIRITLNNEPLSEWGQTVSIEITNLDLKHVSNLNNLPEMIMEQYRHVNKLCGVPDEVTERMLSKIHCEAQSR